MANKEVGPHYDFFGEEIYVGDVVVCSKDLKELKLARVIKLHNVMIAISTIGEKSYREANPIGWHGKKRPTPKIYARDCIKRFDDKIAMLYILKHGS